MAGYKRRHSPAPAFRQPAPFDPTTGQYAPMGKRGIQSRLALMQVIEADEHDNYVVCRGFDPGDGHFYNSIPVAKPYALRGGLFYGIAQVLVCAKIRGRLGDNPGVRTDGKLGQVMSLDEEIELLTTDDGQFISWLHIEPPAMDLYRFEMTDALTMGGSAEALFYFYDKNEGKIEDEPPAFTATVYDALQANGCFSKMATVFGDVGACGWAVVRPQEDKLVIVWMQTPDDFYGSLAANLAQSSSTATVNPVSGGVWGGYNLFGENWKAATSNVMTVYNPVGGGNTPRGAYWFSGAAGDRVLCRWDMANARYWIVACEPNNYGWQDLDVCTAVGGTVNIVTGEFTDTSTYATIQLPPWTTIT